jgi:hypothetical protein
MGGSHFSPAGGATVLLTDLRLSRLRLITDIPRIFRIYEYFLNTFLKFELFLQKI